MERIREKINHIINWETKGLFYEKILGCGGKMEDILWWDLE